MTALLTLTLAACLAAPPADPAAAFEQAEKHFAADRPGAAEPLYRAALAAPDKFTVRQSYERLLALYRKSARPDKVIQTAGPYRAWLTAVGDAATAAQLDVACGESFVELARYDDAEAAFAAALAATPPLPADYSLRAYRGRADVAQLRQAADAPARWKALEDHAAAVRAAADTAGETGLRILADRARAEALHARGDAAAALALLADLPLLHAKVGDALGRRDTQALRAKILAAAGRYDEAVPLFREAVDIHRKERPKKRMVAADILVEWAAAADGAGRRPEAATRRDEAAAEYQAVIAAASKAGGEPSLDLESPFAAFVKLQQLTRTARQFRKALDLTREAGERWADDAVVGGLVSRNRGMMELLSAAYPLARDLLRKALADLEAAEPKDLRSVSLVAANLAAAELALGDGAAAERHVARVAELYRTHRLPDDAVRAECEYHAGAAAVMRGGYAEAVARFRAGLAICDRVGPTTDPTRFNLLLNTAYIHQAQGDLPTAAAALDQAATVLARFAEPGDLSGGLIAAVRADIALSQRQPAAAMKHVPTIEKACEANGVTGGFLVATARHVRAVDLFTRQDLAAAAAVWAQLAEKQRAEGHVLLAQTLNFLGVVRELQGRPAEAKAFLDEARAFEAAHPRCPPRTQCITLWRLAVLAEKAGDRAVAKKLAAEVFDVADRARLNTFGEAAQRAAFYAQFNPIFEQLARWHAADGEADGVMRVITRSRSRTLLDQILAAGVDPRDRLTGPDRDKLLKQEGTIRETISRLRAEAQFLSDKDPKAKRVAADLERAQQDYAEAWKEIVNADPVTRALTDQALAKATASGLPAEPAYATTAVLAYLVGRDESYAILAPGGGRPAELFRLNVPQKLAESVGDVPPGEPTYVSNRRGITIVPLGPQPDAPPADAGPTVALTTAVATRIVDHYLRQIAAEDFKPQRGIKIVLATPAKAVTAARSETLGDVALPPALRDRLRALQPDRVVVIPDGAFHKVPFECLVVTTPAGGRYAIDELPPLVYSPSPAILAAVASRPKPTGPNRLLTVGDPAYDRDRVAAPATAVARRDASEINFRGTLPRLKASSAESRRVRDAFPADQVTALLGEAATEKAVVAAMAGQRFVHVAAHGFSDDRFGNLFAAIALTPPKEVVSADDDGFLSLHEIHRLKLAGCDLTVLSACTTNVGPQRPLEAGVTLAGAFLCAGSRRVMASCWSVDDAATAEMMATFFQLIKPGQPGGQSYPEAMRNARLKVRNTPGWEAPFYWAPFVFVGVPD